MNARDMPRVGWTEMLQRLEGMPAFLATALHEAGDGELTVRPSAEEFALVEQACHLRDVEREAYLVRVRRVLSEDQPELAGFDGTAVARERGYIDQDAHAAAQEFAAARRELLALIAPLTSADFARAASFGGKRITLADLIAMIDAHDGEHREEIEHLLDDIEE